jgi:membrane protease YdiL (CAAX protease family)
MTVSPADATPETGTSPAVPRGISHLAIVRFLVEALALIAIVVATGLVSRFLVPASPPDIHHKLLMLTNLVSAVTLLLVYALTIRLMEHRSATEINPIAGAPQFLLGAILGVVLISAVYAVLWGLHLTHYGAGTGTDGLIGGLVAMFCVAILEELLLRAVLFRIVEDATGTTVAVIVSAAVFGLLHGLNHGATAVSTVAIALEAGILLAMAYALTRNLWFAIGIHMAWNFTEGDVFGAQVSGGTGSHSLYRFTLTGPDLLTGGSFGPEASVVAVGVCLFAAIVIGVMVVRRGNWRSAHFQLRLA